jgi:hypothetical protein
MDHLFILFIFNYLFIFIHLLGILRQRQREANAIWLGWAGAGVTNTKSLLNEEFEYEFFTQNSVKNCRI